MSMKVMIFDVEHGACAFLRSPTGHAVMIDCGCTQGFSPALYIAEHELPTATGWNNYLLTLLTITHPHDDHISDIETVEQECVPGFLKRQIYDWEEVKTAECDYDNLDEYAKWQGKYTSKADPPDYGMSIQWFCLTPAEAKAIGEAKYINNSSIVTIVTVKGTQYEEKFLFGGDMETAGWEALLKRDDFKTAIKGVDFFIVSHHGHESGFSEALFAAMGRKPYLNIVSIHHNDEHIDERYKAEAYSIGTEVEGEQRHMLTTRCDGTVTIHVTDEGQFQVTLEHLDNNQDIAKAASSW